MSKKFLKTLLLLAFSLSLLNLTACVKTTKLVGYTFEGKDLTEIVPGKTRKAIVKRQLGSPSVTSQYGADTWYYISTQYESVAFLDPKIKSQKILAIEFDGQTVKYVKQYSEDDARSVRFSKDQTPTEGHDVGVLGQLLGNVGRFNSDRRDITKPR